MEALVLVLTLGGPLIWAMLLNLRDRREARLLGIVLDHVGSPDLRGRVAVRVRSSVLWPRSLVTVWVLSYSRDEIWELLRRLSERLSPGIRLELTGPLDQHLLATFTVEGKSARRHVGRSTPSWATG